MIHILDDATINKIAAGEVVEGPYSIIKELVENSIDAKASSITVEIKDGGKKYIRVTDNGEGIHSKEVEVAFQRHTTSKIVKVEDLTTIVSLGFRGEALASIAAVSQVEMITRTPKETVGVALEIHGGVIVSKKPIGCPVGTTIIVKNLFYNTPARLKFLKSNQGETSKITEIITRLALSKEGIAFKYINNNNIMFTTPGDNQLAKTIVAVFQQDWFRSMLEIKDNNEELRVYGYIGESNLYRGNRNYQIVFVNGRYVKSKVISNALEEAYRERIPVNKYPICVLRLHINPVEIDVNVHPSKTEIKFHNEELIWQHVNNIVKNTLIKKSPLPRLVVNNAPLQLFKTNYETTEKNQYIADVIDDSYPVNNATSEADKVKGFNDKSKFKDLDADLIEAAFIEKEEQQGFIYNIEKESIVETQENFLSSLLNDYKYIGQIFNSYIAIEKDTSMYLIDQHAAHERLTYTKLLKEYKNNAIISQCLLEPYILHLNNEDYILLKENFDKFIDLGFDLEEFGHNSVIIRSVPMVMGTPTNYNFIYDVLDYAKGSNTNLISEEEIILKACKASIKGMDRLKEAEVHGLIKELTLLSPPLTCPHGRPILLTISKYDIEKLFKRIQ